MRDQLRTALCLSNTDIYWTVLKRMFISETDPFMASNRSIPLCFLSWRILLLFALWKPLNYNLIAFVKHAELFNLWFSFKKLLGLLFSLNRAWQVREKSTGSLIRIH